eukprot:CAMPEP_0197849396 /NCGR_PEP_ID=MMETSP1438-20131217/11898_1 /TAXON_ID=1461541 /ORGANISM="Pterosperma sp., Strain CCMP1384" /LENGTH=294 /DNA_ID=CAMNT_0043462059 /DNA_START=225 /DNA_END=1109 /DNA_ORIENTATION=+
MSHGTPCGRTRATPSEEQVFIKGAAFSSSTRRPGGGNNVLPQQLRMSSSFSAKLCAAKQKVGVRLTPHLEVRNQGMGDREKRRKGRPAWKRSPDDTPLRDGNRDRIMGLLTARAVATLMQYTMETNQPLHHWISKFYMDNQIPSTGGSWEDISGETFMRTLMMTSPTTQGHPGIDPLFDCTAQTPIDPRNIASRIMDIRTILAKEWVEDLLLISEENGSLLRESLMSSLEGTLSMEASNSTPSVGDNSLDADDVCDPDDDECNAQLMEEWKIRMERINASKDDDKDSNEDAKEN